MRERSHQGIVEIEGVAGMRGGAFLCGVEFVHLVHREREQLVVRQRERLARGERKRPIAGSDVVGPARLEPPGGRQEPEQDAKRHPLLVPAQDDRQEVGVRESAPATDGVVDVGLQLVPRNGERDGRGISSAAQDLLLAHPGEGVQVHQDGVVSGDRQGGAVVILRGIAGVEEQLVGVSESRFGGHAGTDRAHAERIHTATLRVHRRRENRGGHDCASTDLTKRHRIRSSAGKRSREMAARYRTARPAAGKRARDAASLLVATLMLKGSVLRFGSRSCIGPRTAVCSRPR